jgi:plastocyanin
MLRRMVRTLLVALSLVLVGCATETAAPPPAESPTPEATPEPTESPSPTEEVCVDATITGQAEVPIRQRDNFFSPTCLSVLAGQGLAIQNRGANLHNFSIEGTQVDIDTRPGEATRTEAIGGAVESGTYTFFCKYYRSEGMEGELTITQAG